METLVDVRLDKDTKRLIAIPKPLSGKAGEYLAAFLESDVQGSIHSVDVILSHIMAVQSKAETVWSRIGNSYMLELSLDSALLEDQYIESGSDKRVEVTLTQLKAAMESWKAAIHSRKQSGK